MEDNRKFELNEEQLDSVAGGQEISEMPDWQEGNTPVGAITEA